MRSAIEMDKYNTITLHHIALHCIDSDARNFNSGGPQAYRGTLLL